MELRHLQQQLLEQEEEELRNLLQQQELLKEEAELMQLLRQQHLEEKEQDLIRHLNQQQIDKEEEKLLSQEEADVTEVHLVVDSSHEKTPELAGFSVGKEAGKKVCECAPSPDNESVVVPVEASNKAPVPWKCIFFFCMVHFAY